MSNFIKSLIVFFGGWGGKGDFCSYKEITEGDGQNRNSRDAQSNRRRFSMEKLNFIYKKIFETDNWRGNFKIFHSI